MSICVRSGSRKKMEMSEESVDRSIRSIRLSADRRPSTHASRGKDGLALVPGPVREPEAKLPLLDRLCDSALLACSNDAASGVPALAAGSGVSERRLLAAVSWRRASCWADEDDLDCGGTYGPLRRSTSNEVKRWSGE